MTRGESEQEPSQQLRESRQRAADWRGPVDIESLTALASHRDSRERLLALSLMASQIYDAGVPPAQFLPLARKLVADPDNDCRWQALFVVAESLGDHVDEVWDVVLEHGDTADKDMQAGVACVVLEHLLDEHFDELLPKLRVALREKSENFARTVEFASHWLGEGSPRHRRVQQAIRLALRGRPRRTG